MEGPAHEDAGYAFEVAGGEVVEDDDRVFAAEFNTHGYKGFGGRGADVVGDRTGADEGYVGDVEVGG